MPNIMLFLYRIYQFLVAAPILLAATIITALAIIVLSVLGIGRWAGNTIPAYWAKLFCMLTLVKVTVTGRQNIKPGTSYVFVCNHQGAYDIF